ncbi:helix-turn-helix transcriptional regulator [Aureimonas sp. ME7]|uniref:helix-turn-helix domain-containing protein n=1 Tax=Aureimonas sp. ME7 TaxID=2744252 RepID=UPI0015F43D03|nr:helix-turn-helix transcriptional regulator [Aureimonas sp. ME7]
MTQRPVGGLLSNDSSTGRLIIDEFIVEIVILIAKDPIDIHIGSRLRFIRDKRSMTLGHVGRKLGLTYQQIRKYESGDNRLSASRLYQLSALFGVEPAFFYDGLDLASAWGPSRGGGADHAALDPVLKRIANPEARYHIEKLIQILGGLQGEQTVEGGAKLYGEVGTP